MDVCGIDLKMPVFSLSPGISRKAPPLGRWHTCDLPRSPPPCLVSLVLYKPLTRRDPLERPRLPSVCDASSLFSRPPSPPRPLSPARSSLCRPMATKKQSQSGLLLSLLKPDVAEDQDAFKDVLYWMRQVLAVLFGLVWGIAPITGGIGIIGFLVLSTALVMGYYTLVVKVDADELGGHGALLQEGLFNSFGVFLLVWILLFTYLHAS
ncbi:unnamed protein product [Closterium sp. Yama58-4]|nr:unnamed protein product [Closterium sp. Yama58-4]